jgi:hypothetical protein
MIDLDTVQSPTHCLFGLSAQQRDNRTGVSTEKALMHLATNKQHYHIPLTSSDTSQPMVPGQHSSVLCIGIQVVQPSQEYSVAPSDRFIPLATRHQQNEGIQSIQVPRRKPRINAFNMFDLDSMKSLLHCWFEVSVQQRDNRRGVSSGWANGRHQQQEANISIQNSPHGIKTLTVSSSNIHLVIIVREE